MTKLVLTRTKENNLYLKEYLISKNYEVLEEPMIEQTIDVNSLKSIDLTNKKILITSNFLAKSLKDLVKNPKDIFIYVIGENSAQILRDSGFKVIDNFPNIEELVKNINDEEIIYLRGNYISHPISFNHKEIIVYNSIYKKTFTSNLINQIKSEQIDIITIFSEQTANSIINAINYHNLGNYFKKIVFYCFSMKIAKIFDKKGFLSKNSEKSEINSYIKLF